VKEALLGKDLGGRVDDPEIFFAVSSFHKRYE